MGGSGRQRGVALITAVLVVALAAVAAAAMTTRQTVDVRRAANVMDADQAQLYLLGAEAWAAQVLRRDLKDNKTDSFDDDWAVVLPAQTVEGGAVSGAVTDLQGRFNLNNLVRGNKVDALALERFRRLLAVLGLAPELASAVVDWLDENEEPLVDGGAEDSLYLGLQPPYRAGNGPMYSASELLQVHGVTPEIYAKLAPYVFAARPVTAINVNTAPEPVLRALAADISEEAVKKLVQRRKDKPWNTVAEFLQEEALAGTGIQAEGLAVASSHFLLQAEATVGRLTRRLNAVLYRPADGKVRTVLRSYGAW